MDDFAAFVALIGPSLNLVGALGWMLILLGFVATETRRLLRAALVVCAWSPLFRQSRCEGSMWRAAAR